MVGNAQKQPLNKEKLVKLLNLSFSENDNEALSAIRMANAMVKNSFGLWNDVLSIPKTEEQPNRASYRNKIFWPEGERIFNDLDEYGEWSSFVDSVFDQYMNQERRLTQKQIDIILKLHRDCCEG